MYTLKPSICRYCEYMKDDRCPFFLIKIIREPDDHSCGQYRPLQDISKFKERKEIDVKVEKQKEEAKKVKGPAKRSIEI